MPTITHPTTGSTELEPGCYVAGHAGQYAGPAMVQLADDLLHGAPTTMAPGPLLAAWPRGDDGRLLGTYGRTGSPWAGIQGDDDVELMVDLMDKAEAALNAATTDGYWSWEDGEFFLVDTDDDLEDMVDA